MDPLKSLSNIDALLGQLSLSRADHVKVQQDVACIKQALEASQAEE